MLEIESVNGKVAYSVNSWWQPSFVVALRMQFVILNCSYDIRFWTDQYYLSNISIIVHNRSFWNYELFLQIPVKICVEKTRWMTR